MIKWKKLRPDQNYVTVLAPYGKWDRGTFIAIQTWSIYDVFLYSLEDPESLYKVLKSTKKINWKKLFVFYAVQKSHFPQVLRILHEIEFPLDHAYDVWWMSKEDALKLNINDCPPEVYVKPLEPIHTKIINVYWPSSLGSLTEKYLSTFIELNGGYGVFLKSTNALVAWILRNQIGLGALQTLEEHRRKGYGSLVTKHLARKIAEDGEDPLGTVSPTNVESQATFRKLGFTAVEHVVFTEATSVR